jgi:hypothetical protein
MSERPFLKVPKFICGIFKWNKSFPIILDANPSFSGVLDAKFDLFGHGIGLAQLAVGVIGLGTVIGLYAVKHHQRATSKFFNSLLATSENKLSKIRYSQEAR